MNYWAGHCVQTVSHLTLYLALEAHYMLTEERAFNTGLERMITFTNGCGMEWSTTSWIISVATYRLSIDGGTRTPSLAFRLDNRDTGSIIIVDIYVSKAMHSAFMYYI